MHILPTSPLLIAYLKKHGLLKKYRALFIFREDTAGIEILAITSHYQLPVTLTKGWPKFKKSLGFYLFNPWG